MKSLSQHIQLLLPLLLALTTAPVHGELFDPTDPKYGLDPTYPVNGYEIDETDMNDPDVWQNFIKTHPAIRTRQSQNKKVLFLLGNSFTERNTLALRIRNIWRQGAGIPGGVGINTPRESPGGATLGAHYLNFNGWRNDGEEDKIPKFKTFDWLIIQDQSITPAVPQWRFSNNFYWGRLCTDFFSPDVPIMLWQTWGYRHGFDKEGLDYTYLEMTEALLDGYLEYIGTARMNGFQNTYLAPVGEVWATIYKDCVAAGIAPRSDDCLWSKFYENDGSHPAGPGTYAAGMTIAVSMTGLSPYEVNYNSLGEGMTNGRLNHEIVRDAVSRVIRETFNSGLIEYPFDDIWDYQPFDWPVITSMPTPAPTLVINILTNPPTPVPTPQPTLAGPTTSPTEMLAFNAIFMGNTNYLVSNQLVDLFDLAYNASVPEEERGPVNVATSAISQWDNAPLSPPAAFNERTVDWVVLQESIDASSVPNGHNESIASLAGAVAIHKGLSQNLQAQTMFLMPMGAEDGYTVTATVNQTTTNVTYHNFTHHTDALWQRYMQYVSETSARRKPTYLAPAGLVAETIYMDTIEEGSNPFGRRALFSRLFDDDGVRPSRLGRFMIAFTLATSLSGVDPATVDLTAIVQKYSFVNADTAAQIQDAVSRTIRKTKAKGLKYPWDNDWPTPAPTAAPTTAAPTEASVVATSKSSSDVPNKEVPSASNVTDIMDDNESTEEENSEEVTSEEVTAEEVTSEEVTSEEEASEELHSQGASPELEEVLGLGSGGTGWLMPGVLLLLGQTAFAWIL